MPMSSGNLTGLPAVVSRGIDRSHFQGTGDPWPGLKTRYHLTWGACKATEGATFVDPTFAWNWAGMKTAGLTRVAYMYAHPELPYAGQVDLFLSVVKPVIGDVLCVDLERGTTMAATNKWIKAALTRLRQKAPGVALIVYMGTGYASTATGAGLSQYADGWWVARYPGLRSWPTVFNPTLAGNTTGFPGPVIWQWTDQFAGRYDANVSTLSAVQIATPKGTDMPLTPADVVLLLNWPMQDPRDPTNPDKRPTLGTWIRQADIEGHNANAALAVQAKTITDLQGQVQALTDAVPALVSKAVSDAIAAGLVTVQINARESA